MKRIFLVGYMGSGKTTLGRAYAHEAGLEFIDLDWYIEGRMHKTVGELFAERGESGFREVERNMLHEVGEFENVVLACGGGTPCFFDNMDYMNAVGETVFLDVCPDVLFRRLKVAKSKRPLLADKSDDELMDAILSALARRVPFYSQAKYRFNAELLEDYSQIGESVKRLDELLDNQNQNINKRPHSAGCGD